MIIGSFVVRKNRRGVYPQQEASRCCCVARGGGWLTVAFVISVGEKVQNKNKIDKGFLYSLRAISVKYLRPNCKKKKKI